MTRLRRSLVRRPAPHVAAALGAALLVAGCASPTTSGPGTEGAATTAASAATEAADPATAHACRTFFGDPDYLAPQSFEVLAMAASVREVGAEDPAFFASVSGTIDQTFAESSPAVHEAGSALATWFVDESAKGAQADAEAFAASYASLASACAPTSVAAAWHVEPGAEGTKPAALVCAEIAVQPQTLSHFHNANTLTSNMFDLVGLAPRQVRQADIEQITATNALLEAQRVAVDDNGVRAAIAEVQRPFQEAIDGDLASPGLRDPLGTLGVACDAAGYSGAVDVPAHGESGEGDEGDGSTLP